jgi:hypothetical protein
VFGGFDEIRVGQGRSCDLVRFQRGSDCLLLLGSLLISLGGDISSGLGEVSSRILMMRLIELTLISSGEVFRGS